MYAVSDYGADLRLSIKVDRGFVAVTRNEDEAPIHLAKIVGEGPC